MANLNTWKWLAQISPGFSLRGSTVRVLTTPDAFYQALLDKVQNAKSRISFASLYIGNGTLEKQLVQSIHDRLRDNDKLSVKFLLDYSRGNRGEQNSCTLLQPLVDSSETCKVFLYHTPDLRGWTKSYLPQRWNEIVGVQHMKIYIVDDSVMISGANLSNDYFTNRQDRCLLIDNCKELVDFYDGLIDNVGALSFLLGNKNSLNLAPGCKNHPSDGNYQHFVTEARSKILSYYETYVANNTSRLSSFHNKCAPPVDNAVPGSGDSLSSAEDTWIFPLIQMGPLGIGLDTEATCKVLQEAPSRSSIKLATGYFNLTSEYTDVIVKDSKAAFDLLMAHKTANGFLGAKGFAGGIPAAYTQLAKIFYGRVKDTNQLSRIAMWEYLRKGWTFHSKGLWYYPPDEQLPVLTLVGSPNFGHRSVYRDLESQIYMITLNNSLQKQLHNEQQELFKYSNCVNDKTFADSSYHVPLWVKLVLRFFRNFF